MNIISRSFNPELVEWRNVTDPNCKEFKVDFDYSLLGYDIKSGRLDMLLRYASLSHCRRHRHVASTLTMVLEGEQHLTEWQHDGSKKSIMHLQVLTLFHMMKEVEKMEGLFFYLCMHQTEFYLNILMKIWKMDGHYL